MMIFAFGACSKQDDAPIVSGGGALPEGHPSTDAGGGAPMVTPVTDIIVPDEVKAKYASVVLTIENKVKGTAEDVTINMNSEYKIPESNVTVTPSIFLPDFIMDGPTITSKSPEMNNPAVKIKVTEGDAEIFDNWLYSRFPAIHPFQHETYSIMLKEGVSR